MTERSVTHTNFTIERTYDAAPALVFAAFATREAKAKWFGGPADKWKELIREFDFRVGGRERVSGKWAEGPVSHFNCHYHDIVPNERIVYSYDMKLNDKPISVSLATIQFKPAGRGTTVVVTEQGAFLDDYEDNGSRERGTGGLLDRLGESLKRESASS
jgi:uncharacterized protein YndB with AHSA1/START domain